ncbi:RING-type E3 ubiquitin transferase [Malassezia caprae]|uniref:Pre-mRNA-processing factor 19 n=1 Tax=Malassezia caprae TaxID=1381934 RepID=A0AAF0E4B1_9BASI|nr:RING-type E3 ubiquitin transferase [Malassezia caprae]
MFCASAYKNLTLVSGEAPKEPVVSKKSGHVYERRLIEQYIDEHGADPVTKEPLTTDDLLTLQSTPRTAFPRPPTHSSVPSLLGALQNEYDAMVFETLELRKQYDAVRQDLAHALYTNDASMRVIARLMKERDDAREALASVHASLGGASASGDVDMAHDEAPSAPGATLPDDVAAAIDATAARESGERRARIKRGAPAPYPTPATASSLHETQSTSALHSASSPGIQSLDVSANGTLLLTGGLDKSVLVLERATDKVLATLQGHTQAVTAVAFSGRSNAVAGPASSEAPLPPYAVSASADKTVRVWRHTGESYELLHVLDAQAEVTGVDVHPTDAYVGCASSDGAWALYALDSGACLLRVPPPTHASDDGAGFAYTSFAFHPDGQLAATGTADGAIRVWDVKLGRQSALFTGHAGAVHTLHFAPNGYLLAAASRDDAHAKIWDLRKLAVTRTVEAAPGIEQVRFDPTAQLLAIVGADVRVMGGKTLEPYFVSEPCTLPATSVQWSPVDGALLVAGLDRTVRTYLP